MPESSASGLLRARQDDGHSVRTCEPMSEEEQSETVSCQRAGRTVPSGGHLRKPGRFSGPPQTLWSLPRPHTGPGQALPRGYGALPGLLGQSPISGARAWAGPQEPCRWACCPSGLSRQGSSQRSWWRSAPLGTEPWAPGATGSPGIWAPLPCAGPQEPKLGPGPIWHHAVLARRAHRRPRRLGAGHFWAGRWGWGGRGRDRASVRGWGWGVRQGQGRLEGSASNSNNCACAGAGRPGRGHGRNWATARDHLGSTIPELSETGLKSNRQSTGQLHTRAVVTGVFKMTEASARSQTLSRRYRGPQGQTSASVLPCHPDSPAGQGRSQLSQEKPPCAVGREPSPWSRIPGIRKGSIPDGVHWPCSHHLASQAWRLPPRVSESRAQSVIREGGRAELQGSGCVLWLGLPGS